MDLPLWAQHFNLTERQLARWKHESESHSDSDRSLLHWCLLNGKVDESQYLGWAAEHYGLPLVTSGFFSAAPDPQFWSTARPIWPWRTDLAPIAQWDGMIYLACLAPPENFPAFIKSCFVLATAGDLERWWKKLQNLSGEAVVAAPNLITEAVEIVAEPHVETTEPVAATPVAESRVKSAPVSEPDSDLNEPKIEMPEGFAKSAVGSSIFASPLHAVDVSNPSISIDKLNLFNVRKPDSAEPAGWLAPDTVTRVTPQSYDNHSADSRAESHIEGLDEDSVNSPETVSEVEMPAGFNADASLASAASVIDSDLRARLMNMATPGEVSQARPVAFSKPEPVSTETASTQKTIDATNDAVTEPPMNEPFAGADVTSGGYTLAAQMPQTANAQRGVAVEIPAALLKRSTAVVANNQSAEPIEESKTIDELATSALAHVSQTFETGIFLIFKNDCLVPWKWTELALSVHGDNPAPIQLDQPSLFRIVFRTCLPYHGTVYQSEVNQKFFNDMNRGRTPLHATLVPILVQEHMVAVLMGMTDGNIEYRRSLTKMHMIATTVGQTLEPILMKSMSKKKAA
jgi:hypothetical protein